MALVAGAEARVTPGVDATLRAGGLLEGFAAGPPGGARRLCLALNEDLPQLDVTPYLRDVVSARAFLCRRSVHEHQQQLHLNGCTCKLSAVPVGGAQGGWGCRLRRDASLIGDAIRELEII